MNLLQKLLIDHGFAEFQSKSGSDDKSSSFNQVKHSLNNSIEKQDKSKSNNNLKPVPKLIDQDQED